MYKKLTIKGTIIILLFTSSLSFRPSIEGLSLISSDCSAGKDKIGVFPNSLLRLDVTPRHAGAKTNRLQGSSKWVEALGRYFIDLETYHSPDQLAFQILVLPKVYIIQTVFTNKLK